jgi:hypothetical protein
MPYDLYWNGASDAFFLYCEKTKREYERKQRELDFAGWMLGLYTRDAILSIYQALNPMAGKNAKEFPYPEKPRIQLSDEDKKKSEEAKRREIYEQFSAWAKAFKDRPKPKRKEEKTNG